MRDSCNASNCGCIVNIASAAGVFPLEGASVYTASKHAVIGFTRSFTFSSVAPNYVKVCALAPGFTKTPMLDKVIHNSAMQRNAIETVGVLEPSEVADALLSVIDATPSGGVVYISRSTGVWAPFENQMKVWRDAVRSHRKRQRAKL
jgi:short-subunit dehydrogenase